MSLTTGLIVGLGLAGGLGGVSMCSKPQVPKYQVGDCVRHVDSFGEYDSNVVRRITKMNDTDYGVIVYLSSGHEYKDTSDIRMTDKYYGKVSCP